MPIHYARSLAGDDRSPSANRHLGVALAFIAGAINAGGFLAVRQYTSHMTGIVSSVADRLVLGEGALVLGALGAILSFLLGAATTAVMVNYVRRQGLSCAYALPLLLEAVLLLAFGVLGARLAGIDAPVLPPAVPLTVMLLCFMMGLQNAVITKVSQAEIRTTHMTGIVTDLGIELGKLLYWNADGGALRPKVLANRTRLALLLSLLAAFLVGGLAGALGFKYLGYLSTVPLAAFLCLLAIVPAADEALRFLARQRPGN